MQDGGGDPFDDDPYKEVEPKRDDRGFAERVIPDVVRKTFLTGVGAVLLGEEGLRGSLSDMKDMKMPKEAMSYIVAQADRTKREAINALARELRQFLDGLDLQGLVEKSLAGTEIEIQTKIRVIQKAEGGVGVDVVDNQTEVSRHDADDAADEEAPKKKRSTKKKSASKKRSSSTKTSED